MKFLTCCNIFQHKYQEALDVVKSPLGEKLSAGVVETKEGEYNQQLKRWGRVMECFAALLSQNPDHWNYYVQYLEALFEHSASDSEAVGRAKELILNLARQEKEKDKDKLRGPYLALIFFWQQLQSRNLDSLALLGIGFDNVVNLNVYQHSLRFLQETSGHSSKITWPFLVTNRAPFSI